MDAIQAAVPSRQRTPVPSTIICTVLRPELRTAARRHRALTTCRLLALSLPLQELPEPAAPGRHVSAAPR